MSKLILSAEGYNAINGITLCIQGISDNLQRLHKDVLLISSLQTKYAVAVNPEFEQALRILAQINVSNSDIAQYNEELRKLIE